MTKARAPVDAGVRSHENRAFGGGFNMEYVESLRVHGRCGHVNRPLSVA
jgi:hypothetical protein